MWKLYEHPIHLHTAVVVVPDIGEHFEEVDEAKYWTLEDREAGKAIHDNNNSSELYRYTNLPHAVIRCSELNKRDYDSG